jgi:hypothetical protein
MAYTNTVLKFKGEALWAKLVEPDFKFNTKYGDYSIRLRISEEDAEKYFEVLAPLLRESHREAQTNLTKQHQKNSLKIVEPFKAELNDDTGQPTGFYLFNFKQPAVIFSKKTNKEYPQKIAIFHGKQPAPLLEIGNGSTVTVAFEPRAYYSAKDNTAGLSLRLRGVLVHNCVEVSGHNLFDDGDFGEDDDSVLDAPRGTTDSYTPPHKVSTPNDDESPF